MVAFYQVDRHSSARSIGWRLSALLWLESFWPICFHIVPRRLDAERGRSLRRGLLAREGFSASRMLIDPHARANPRQNGQLSVIGAGAQKMRPGFALDPRGKEVKIQGVSVLPTRKPRLISWKSRGTLARTAERRSVGLSPQEPPRTTRRLQTASVHCEPSPGAPS